MTTIVINQETGLISSDSRGTTTNTHFQIKLKYCLPVRHQYTTTFKRDNITKIFKAGNVVISGTGDLSILKHLVNHLENNEGKIPDQLQMHRNFDMSDTAVYIIKRVLGKVRTIKLEITPKKRIFSNTWKLNIVKSVQKDKIIVDGSGWRFATGALSAGSNEITSIEIAAKHDDGTGGLIQQVYI